MLMKNKWLYKIGLLKQNTSERFVNKYLARLIAEDFIPNNYTFFTSPEEINHWGSKYVDYFNGKEKEYNDSIFYESTHQREISYPHAVFNWYCGWHYIHINNYLRGFSAEGENKRINIITNEIKKFVLEQEIVCVRRVSNTFFEEYLLNNQRLKKGVIFSDEAFVSTSLDIFYRKDKNSNYKSLENETLMILKLKKSTCAIYLEPVSKREEYELLLKNGIEFVIERTKNIFGNKIVVARCK